MNLWQSVNGMLQIEITSADPEGMLEALNAHGVTLFHVEARDLLTVRCFILRSDYKRVLYLCEKQGNAIHILNRKGLYWWTGKLLQRPVLILGLAILSFFIAFLPTRVFLFAVEGNSSIPEHRILEAAESCGIRFGVSRREVRSEKMKNALLGAVPELKWAGINTSGCRAVISVREREQTEQPDSIPGITRMIAAQDGLITSCTVTNGNELCSVGQTVQKGQLLISPYMDCGITIKVVPVEGEVYAQTNRKITAVMPLKRMYVQEHEKEKRRYNLIFGKKRINLWKDSGISDATCGRMYEEYYFTLPGGFQLPVCLGIETIYSRKLSAMEISQESAEHMLTDFSAEYVCNQMIAGSVLAEKCTIRNDADIWLLKAEYVCNEMIGRIIAERNGETNE